MEIIKGDYNYIRKADANAFFRSFIPTSIFLDLAYIHMIDGLVNESAFYIVQIRIPRLSVVKRSHTYQPDSCR